jgi:hypothetical protein
VKLPNGTQAIVELAKLTEYCLDPEHPRGRHKARVFVSRLGLAQQDASVLRVALLEAAETSDEAREGPIDGFGQRYVLDFVMQGPKGSAVFRSAWIIRHGEDFPRFTSCYVL